MKVRVWYRYKHDDYTAEDVETTIANLEDFAYRAKEAGGILIGRAWVPWHSVNYLEQGDE